MHIHIYTVVVVAATVVLVRIVALATKMGNVARHKQEFEQQYCLAVIPFVCVQVVGVC